VRLATHPPRRTRSKWLKKTKKKQKTQRKRKTPETPEKNTRNRRKEAEDEIKPKIQRKKEKVEISQ